MDDAVTSLNDIDLILKSLSGVKVTRYIKDITIQAVVKVKSNKRENESNHIYGEVTYMISLEVHAKTLSEVFHFEDPIEVCKIVVDDTEVLSISGLLQGDDMNQSKYHYMNQLAVLINQELLRAITINNYYDKLSRMRGMRHCINMCLGKNKVLDEII